MHSLGIELCDGGILAVFDADHQPTLIPLEGKESYLSPAFACYDGQACLTGQKAEDCARLYPKNTSTRFWHNLSLDDSEVKVEGKSMLFSELAYYHFEHIWKAVLNRGCPEKVVLALPSHILIADATQDEDEKKIGLILGMVADLGIPLVGIVDQACAALASSEITGKKDFPQALYLDLQQHSISISVLEKKEASFTLKPLYARQR